MKVQSSKAFTITISGSEREIGMLLGALANTKSTIKSATGDALVQMLHDEIREATGVNALDPETGNRY